MLSIVLASVKIVYDVLINGIARFRAVVFPLRSGEKRTVTFGYVASNIFVESVEPSVTQITCNLPFG